MRKLTLADWASLAEVVGGISVVLSLIYVGVQINENTIEVREANRQELVNRSVDATGRAAENQALALAIAKVFSGDELTATEATQYAYFVRGMLYDVQEAFLLHSEGRLGASYWKTRRSVFAAYLSSPSAVEVYEQDKSLGILHDEFVLWADERLSDVE